MRRLAATVITGVFLESGTPITRTRLMKLLFLVRHETIIPSTGAFYDFLPYQYGPYSFAADRDLWELMRNGVAVGDKLQLTEWRQAEALTAYEALAAPVRVQVRELVDRYRSWSDHQLIDHVYAKYPNYTVLSKRPGVYPSRQVAAPAVYTLGYEGSSVDAFLRASIVHGLARIIDVRNNPVSRRYGYSKATLLGLCDKIGVEYAHVPGLGVPAAERQSLGDAASYGMLLDRYERETLPRRAGDLARVSAMMREKASALLCFEADATRCHRGRLAPCVATLTGLPVCHLEVPRG
jgi:uncharacterized protein (DUF488 family)